MESASAVVGYGQPGDLLTLSVQRSGHKFKIIYAQTPRGRMPDLLAYVGRLQDYFTRHPDRHRLMTRGQMELPAGQP